MLTTIQEQLSRAFKANEHEWNYQKHIYVSVNATIKRLNSIRDEAGDPLEWSFTHKHFESSLNPNDTSGGKPQYDCFCVGELYIPGLGTRMGTGGDTNADPDTAAKSAQAYSFRKGANLHGVAFYLLDNPKEENDLVNFLLKADVDSTEDMKKAVVDLMKIRKIDPSAANLVKEFGITLDEIKNDPEIFYKILVKENRI